MTFNRRQFMAGSSLLAAAPLMATSPPIGQPRITLSPEETLHAWMKLACALDDRLVIWWMDGVRYGVVDSRATPLYGMKVGIFQRYFQQPGGFWKLAMFELTYYTDLTTGKLLEQYDNPYTGETNNVRHVRLGPEIRHQTITGQQADPNDQMVQSMLKDYATTLGAAEINGDWISIPTSVQARIEFPKPTAPDIRLSIYTTATGSMRDLNDPKIISAPCSLAFQNILKWEPWMGMRDHEGTMMSRATGRKLDHVKQLPADYLQMAREVHPWLIKDPLETLSAKVGEIAAETAAPNT